MKSQILMILLASAAMLMTTAMAQNPVDIMLHQSNSTSIRLKVRFSRK